MSHPTKNSIVLHYHNSLECIESLFNHLYYASHMDYTPFRLFTIAERIVWEYTEWMGTEVMWWMQVSHIKHFHVLSLINIVQASRRCNIVRDNPILR